MENIDILKEVAFMQYNGEDYFIEEGIYFIGNREEVESEWKKFSEISPETYGITFFDFCDENIEKIYGDYINKNYLVLTDDEANDLAADYIKDSVWAFNSDFIIDHTELPYEAKEMIETYQRDKCESANDTILAMIDDIDEFIDNAISADGRGHFISMYDGQENEEVVESPDGEKHYFYIYRMN